MKLTKLPKIETKLESRIVCSPETLSLCLDRMAEKGWNIELKHYRGQGWFCEIRWITDDPELQMVTGNSRMVLRKNKAGDSSCTMFDPTSYDAFVTAWMDWQPRFQEWCEQNPHSEEATKKPSLTVV
jgi:hypothetical protein